MAVDDIWRMTIKGDLQGQQYWVTHHFRQLDNPPGSDWQHLYDQWDGGAQDEWIEAHPAYYQCNEVEIQPVLSSGVYLRDAAQTFSVTRAGSRDVGSTPSAASWLCQVVSVFTERAGKRHRGRYFVSNLSELDFEGDTMSTGTGSAHDTLELSRAALETLFVGDTRVSSYWALGVFSKKGADVHHAGDVTTMFPADYWADAAGLTLRAKLYSQKSRRARPS